MYDTATPSWSVLSPASPLTLWHPTTDRGRLVPEHGCRPMQQWHPSSFDPREPETVKLCTHSHIYQSLTADSNSRAFLPPLSLKLEKQQKAMIIVLLKPNAFYIPSSRQNEIFLEEQIYSSCSRELLRRLHGLRERLNIGDATCCIYYNPRVGEWRWYRLWSWRQHWRSPRTRRLGRRKATAKREQTRAPSLIGSVLRQVEGVCGDFLRRN